MNEFEERKRIASDNLELFFASQRGDIDKLNFALGNGANPNFTNREHDGSPYPLHETAQIVDEVKGVACAKALLDHGADASSRMLTTKNTPLHEGKAVFQQPIRSNNSHTQLILSFQYAVPKLHPMEGKSFVVY